MRSLIVLFGVVVVVCAAGTTQGSINILSEYHKIWGTAGHSPLKYADGHLESYNQESSLFLSESATGIECFGSPTNYYCYAVTASSSAGSSAGSFFIEAHGYRWTAWATAESTYIFQPQEGTLFINLEANGERYGHPFEERVGLKLTDLSTNEILEDTYWPISGIYDDLSLYWRNHFTWEKTYRIDSSHTYSLHLYAWANGGDIGGSGALMGISVNDVVPTPSAFLLTLLGCGIIRLKRKC